MPGVAWPAAAVPWRRLVGARARRLALVLGWASGAPAAPLSAQGFDVVSADPRVPLGTVQQCREIATASMARLRDVFPGTPSAAIRMVVHADAGTVDRDVLEGLPGRFAGFARLGANEFHVLVTATGGQPGSDLRAIITHELVHVLLDQFAAEGAPWVPRWLHEGLAQTLAGAPMFEVAEESLMFGIHARTLPRFVDLVERFPARDDDVQLAYAQSHSFVAFLVDSLGTAPLLEAARACRADVAFEKAFYQSVDTPLAIFQQQWEEYVIFGSGAISRFLQRNCFTFLMILGLPLLAIAVSKRRRRDRDRRDRLAAQEQVDPWSGDQGA